jgi:hypothetical protein
MYDRNISLAHVATSLSRNTVAQLEEVEPIRLTTGELRCVGVGGDISRAVYEQKVYRNYTTGDSPDSYQVVLRFDPYRAIEEAFSVVRVDRRLWKADQEEWIYVKISE